MYCRLNDDYALRAWKFVNHGLYHRYTADPLRVDEKTYDLLMQCDGEHDLEDTEALQALIRNEVVSPCQKGEHPSEWSRYRRYDHRFVPSMNLMITGKCNYNCRHCFNAAENADRMSEWKWDDLVDLIDQAADCGMHSVTLTGGEPMLHPRFLDAVREIYKRNMVLEKLTTNGYFLTEEVLDEFQRLNCHPQIKISFDGIGHHDWMRGHKGAEEIALRAFRLCAQKGFESFAQVQVFRGNVECIRDTLLLLEEIGVGTARLIRTTPVPRWQKNAPDASLPMEEYLEKMLDLADWYMHGGHKMKLIMWQFLNLYPEAGRYHMVPVKDEQGVYHPTRPVCAGNRTMMAVTCEGNVVPCLQMSDYTAHLGCRFDSLKERRLKDILTEGKWLDAVCMNHYALRQANSQCDQCEWFGYCAGGCRALGILNAGETTGKMDYCASDPLACLFFKGGWYERVQKRLEAFTRF